MKMPQWFTDWRFVANKQNKWQFALLQSLNGPQSRERPFVGGFEEDYDRKLRRHAARINPWVTLFKAIAHRDWFAARALFHVRTRFEFRFRTEREYLDAIKRKEWDRLSDVIKRMDATIDKSIGIPVEFLRERESAKSA